MTKRLNQYEILFKKINALIPNLDTIQPGEGVVLKAAGFMDLSINVLWREGDKTTISMTHYYKQNCDLVPDPDMEIAIYPSRKMAEALGYQDSYSYQVVYPEPGKVYPKLRTELNSFLNTWLDNIKMQGHMS